MALGPYNNFYASSANCITSGDTTPDVKLGSLFYTVNTSATSITDFDNGEEGQIINIIMLDTMTTIAESVEIKLAGSANMVAGGNQIISLINHNTAWYEISRSVNVSPRIAYVSTGSAGNTAVVDVRGKSLVTLNASGGAPIQLERLINGVLGQVVTIMNLNSAAIIVNSGGAATILVISSSGGNYVMTGSDSVSFILNDMWREIRDAKA